MSVWADYGTGALVRPGTPDITIRYTPTAGGTPAWTVLADGAPVEQLGEYRAAHLYVQGRWGLTSTPMTAIYADYAAALERDYPEVLEEDEEEDEGPDQDSVPAANPYRKDHL